MGKYFRASQWKQKESDWEDIAAYNVAKHISSEYDLDYLDKPTTLKPLVKTFIVSYSGNYIIEFGQYLE